MKKSFILLLVAVLALVTINSTQPAKAQGKYDGVKINLITFVGPQIAEPLIRRAPEFKKLTGADVNIVTVPFSDLYQTILTDQATKTNSYQAFVLAPQWMVDYVTPGYLEDLSARVTASKDLQWDDVGQFFREFSASYAGKTYTVPLDGDFHMVYYRIDVFKQAGLKPPTTWDEYVADAKAINGMDINGQKIYGSCIAKKRSGQGFWWIQSIASGALQSLGTSQGGFFDTDTFKPLVNNEAFINALNLYKETNKYGPPNELATDVGDSRGLFTAGKCGLTLDWGDIGSLAVAPESKVKDQVGSIILPGSKKILDRKTGKLVDCDAKLCPYAIDGVNHAPFASFGGWAGAVSAAADAKVKDAAFDFFAYMSAPAQSGVDVTIGKTGFNPYRKSHFNNLDNWIKGGFSDAAAKDYLGAIAASLNSPNMMLDLRVPQNQRYQQVVLDEAVSQFLAGELTAEEAAKQISDKWEEITNELGRDKQLAAYRSSLGIKGGN